MKTSVKFSKIAALVLSIILMLTLSIAPIAAETDNGSATDSPAGAETTPEATTEAPAETTPEGTSGSDATTAPETTANGSSTTASSSASTEEKSDTPWDLIVSLIIIGVAVIVLVVLYFASSRFREWVKKFCREYKSELKKIVWSPWKDVRRNSVLVITIAVVAAVIIALLDLVLSEGIHALAQLF